MDEFNFSKPQINSNNENFTQLVWKSTKEVGFGVSLSPNGSYYIVANYYPAGNNVNKLKENVLPINLKQ